MSKNSLREGIERLMDEAADERFDDDGRWQALSFGEVGEEEERALRAEAAESAQVDRQWQAYRPIESPLKQRMLERIQQELAGAASSTDHQAPTAAPAGAATAESESTEPADGHDEASNVVPFHAKPATPRSEAETGTTRSVETAPISRTSRSSRKTPGRWMWSSVAALAAAVLAMVIWPRSPVALPDYQLSAKAGSLGMRAPSRAVEHELKLPPGAGFELFLAPAVAVESALETAVYARRSNGLEKVELRAEASETGSIKLSGHLTAEVLAGASSIDLWVVVAARGSLPESAEVFESGDLAAAGGTPWRLMRCRLLVDETAVDASSAPVADSNAE